MKHSGGASVRTRKTILLTGTALLLLVCTRQPAFADGGQGGGAVGRPDSGGRGGTSSSPHGDGGQHRGGGGGGGAVDLTTGIGGGGGDGASADGPGGVGGAGGTAGKTTTAESNITDSTGTSGSPGTNGSGGPSGGGGGGGGGGFGWVIQEAGSSGNTAMITGGSGGNGGKDGGGGAAGGGGGGQSGGGVLLSGGGALVLSGSSWIAGGVGGDGGQGDAALSHAGAGGDGGAGIVLTTGGSVTSRNGSTILGGAGGNGGSTSNVDGAEGGTGGAGISGSGFILINEGQITGGMGGLGGNSNTEADGESGAGGTGIVGSDLTIINSGAIRGGLSGDGVAHADAINFTGGDNRLELQSGSTINGTVVVEVRATGTLALGGDTDSSFDADQIGDSAQYQGFRTFEKTGASTWTLTGSTSAITPWTLIDGALSISSDGQLGDPSAPLTFDGGILQVTGTSLNGTARDIAWGDQGGGFDIVDERNDFQLVQNVTGSGNLLKHGLGTLTLTGTNTYTGGTQINSGTLQVGNGGTTGSITGDVVNNSTLAFNRSDSVIFNGAVSGTGNLNQVGPGTLTLTGTNTYTGRTTVENGTLLINGASIYSAHTVNSGATLGGTGTVGSSTVASGGILAPGDRVNGTLGTLTVDGDLVFEAGSRFEVEVNPQGSDSDKVAVTGNAILNGGAVAHIGASGNYNPRSTYTILTAGGALSGAFDTVTSNFAFLTPDLRYDYGAGAVDLALVRNDRDFDDDPAPAPGPDPDASPSRLTRNQKATARGVQSIGLQAGHAVYDAVVQLPNDDKVIRDSFDALSGEIHASAKSALIEDSRFIRQAATDRVRAAFKAPGASKAPVAASGPGQTPAQVSANHHGPVVWSQAFGSWGKADSNGNAASLDRNTGGVLIGADRSVGDWRVGVLAGYSHSDFKARDRASSGKSDSYHLGAYGGTQWNALGLRTGLAYTWHDIDTRRSVALPGLQGNPRASYRAGTLQAFGELGYGIELDSVRLEPFVNLAHVRLHTDDYRESGSAAALSGRSDNTDVTFTTLGLRAEHELSVGATQATLRGALGWRHAFGDTTPQAHHGFSAGQAFTVAGVPIAKDSAVVEAGVDLKFAPGATFGLSYAGQLAGSARDHGVKANLTIRF